LPDVLFTTQFGKPFWEFRSASPLGLAHDIPRGTRMLAPEIRSAASLKPGLGK